MKAILLVPLFCLLSMSPALCAQAAAPTQPIATGNSNIEIENWVKPASGWLYVLDPQPDSGGSRGRVWLVDPETTKVMGGIRTGDNADFALSPGWKSPLHRFDHRR